MRHLLPLLLVVVGVTAPVATSVHQNPTPPCGASEGWFVPTDDGSWVFLHHHGAAGPPVLVVHGISSNHTCWDLDRERSLATSLNEAGLDAWLLDMRGHGHALKAPHSRPLKGDWTVDDYALRDVPAAIRFIQEKTGAPRVGYVGHSLGGMVGAIYASQGGQDSLWALVAVGSPIDFRDPDPLLFLTARSFSVSGALLPYLVTPSMARVLDASPSPLRSFPQEILYNPENMEREAASRMMASVVSPLWRGEMIQFARMLGEERFVSADGATDHGDAMARITLPTLVIAGRADRVAPADRVKAYADRVGSKDKRFVTAGLENGFQVDYGHLDLTVGDHARKEIHPLIVEWLLRFGP